jgi:predicted PurR-regulated permease PerM
VSNTSLETARAYRVQWQRLALVGLFILALWGFVRMFSSVLMPFVVAAGLAYF